MRLTRALLISVIDAFVPLLLTSTQPDENLHGTGTDYLGLRRSKGRKKRNFYELPLFHIHTRDAEIWEKAEIPSLAEKMS